MRASGSIPATVSDLIAPGEKFACLALIGTVLQTPLKGATELGYGCWALSQLPVPLDGTWRTWIGSVLAGEIERANVVFLAKARSVDPSVQDAEYQTLLWRVEHLLWGIAIAAGVPAYKRAVCVAGGSPKGPPEVWTVVRPDRLVSTPGMPEVRLDVGDLTRACGVLTQIELVRQAAAVAEGSYARIARGLRAFIGGLRSTENDVRLHQFVRAVEACLSPEDWREDAFVEGVRTFVSMAPDAAPTIREMYRLRGKAEHMDDFRLALRTTRGADRDSVAMRRVRQAHELARRLYESLYSPLRGHLELYRSDESIRRFWREPTWVRRALWGERVDMDAVT